ncbi:glycosyltransferase family 39 protein [Kitasatospora viridis]|uniref:4-amino-4-deoxy-L-arabinose transferase-like glycosyltransferase n=1 Tax=Kitasatospora viridis TaxID=281105 RepID=A0A561SE76_9ACTN|nr:glycosyltransferase family 39 protein [Kitasatospora viridis]TWF73172.1 4-amino-4-deoxy-L-arabinose transferase-like glycosyltransferase [Kitasatospora viridis]
MTPCRHIINTIETPDAPHEDTAAAAATPATGLLVADVPATDVPTADVLVAERPAAPALTTRLLLLLRRALPLPRVLLLLIAALAAVGYAWSLDQEGLETYYAAGVRSMAGSWHAFFYDAFDPQATVTLDKLPGAFWVQALSVRIFGYSVRAMVLPQVVEATLSVLVLYRAVRRVGGAGPALIAAAVLAASPVTLASTRGNLSEPLYLLLLLLAADAVLRAVLLGRRRSGWAAAGWVALAFQAKMAEAWFLLPALVLALVTAAPAGARLRALLRGLLLSATAAALSLGWMAFFALTPAADRPLADGSTHDSVFEQVFLYNGGQRLNQGLDYGLPPLAPRDPAAVRHAALYLTPEHGAGLVPPSTFSAAAWDRLLTAPLGPDAGWLLPLALAGAVLLLVVLPRRLPGSPGRRAAGPLPAPLAELRRIRAAVVLWTGWLLVGVVAFSQAGALHDYYLATLVPAIGALTGLTVTTLWRRARGLLAALLVVQGVWSAGLLYAQPPVLQWLLVLAGCAAGAALLLRGRARGRLRVPSTALALALTLIVLLTGLVTAGVWLLARSGGPFDAPFAASGTFADPSRAARTAALSATGLYGGSIMPKGNGYAWTLAMRGDAQLNTALARQGDMLVYQSTAASGYIMGGVTHLRPIGGFSGNLPSPSVDEVIAMIESRQIGSALVPGPGVLTGTDPRVQAVKDHCTLMSSNPRADYLLYKCP